MGAPWYPPTSLERLSSSVCKRRENFGQFGGKLWPDYQPLDTGVWGERCLRRERALGFQAACPRGRWGRVCVTCSEPPTVGSALGLSAAALHPERCHPCGTDLTCCLFFTRRWLEMLIVYPRTNKQNQKKKRKVEPPTPQVTPGGHTVAWDHNSEHRHPPKPSGWPRSPRPSPARAVPNPRGPEGGARRGAGHSRASSAEAGRNSSGLRLPPWR